jgi:hypothetical protein
MAPARYLGPEGDLLLFDLNHPLAGRDLNLQVKICALHEQRVERGGRCEDWLERTCSDGVGMQGFKKGLWSDYLTADGMTRPDGADDCRFYENPRMVQHLDSTARQIIRSQYSRLIRPGSRVLDLMASWDSHLPEELPLQSLILLGMNQTELEANVRASEYLVHDLNIDPHLPLADSSFDGVLCTASIEYLVNPLAVIREIQRVLVPGGLVVVSFSNRWFPPKAITIWTELHEFERLGMVLEMFGQASGWEGITSATWRGRPRPVDDPHQGYAFSDPVFIAWAQKEA